MRRSISVLLLLLGLVAGLGVSGSIAATPFRARGEITHSVVTCPESTPTCALSFPIDLVAGQATRLGRIEANGYLLYVPVTGGTACVPADGFMKIDPVVGLTEGFIEFAFTGQLCPGTTSQSLDFDGTYTVSRGTLGFAGTTGSGVAHLTYDGTSTVAFSLEGTLDLP